jgi:hypothetical protein
LFCNNDVLSKTSLAKLLLAFAAVAVAPLLELCCSGKKDVLANVGGLLCCNVDALYETLLTKLLLLLLLLLFLLMNTLCSGKEALANVGGLLCYKICRAV